MRAWFLGLDFGAGLPKPVADAVGRAKRECSKPAPSPQLLGALDCVELWTRLDPRTKSNLQSCIFNFLRPLMSAAANRCFEANDRQEFDPAEVAKGRLAVVSVNALTHPDLAKFFLRLARRLFFDAVQARQGGPHPLTGLLADEFGLILQPEDAEELATLRSRSCFVLSATQGISAMQEKIGPRLCQSVLLNFNTMVFMRSREPQTGELATFESRPTGAPRQVEAH